MERKYKQKMILAQADYYDELNAKINDEIQNFKPLYEIQQIDYFSMKETDLGSCIAFILFRPTPGQKFPNIEED